MVDTEVREILSEIRERVRAEAEHLSGSQELVQPESLPDAGEARTPELLARLEEHSRTTLRAWNRLPPLTTKRAGLLARIELWFKRQMRRATHWYAWEQINFNAAVKESLRDVAAALSNHERELAELRQSLAALPQMQSELASHLRAFEDTLLGFEKRLSGAQGIDAQLLRDEVGAVQAEINVLRGRLEESLAHLREEQRVLFKQLSLEIKETARVNKE